MAKPKEVKEKAKKYIDAGNYEKGLALYEKVIEKLESINKPDLVLYNTVGDIYLNKLNDKETAIEYFRSAMDKYSKNALYPNAIAMAKKILKIDDSQIEMYKKIGEFNKEQGLLGEAMNNFILYAEKSIKNNNLKEAIDAFNATLEMMPERVEIRQKLADLYVQSNEIEKAIEVLKDVETYYVKRNEMEQATLIRQKITKYTKSIASKAQPEVVVKEEPIKKEEEQSDDIEIDDIDLEGLVEDMTKTLDSDLEEQPEITEPTVETAKPEKSDDLFDSYIDIANLQKDIDPKEAINFYYQGAEGYESVENYSKALNAYKMIVQLNPNDIKAHNSIIRIAKKTGNMKQAIESLNYIAKMESESNPEEAKKIIENILSIDPSNEKALSLKAQLSPKVETPPVEEPSAEDILSEIKSEAADIFDNMEVFKESEQLTAKDIVKGKNEGGKPKFKVQEESTPQGEGMWSLNELLDELKEGVNEVIAEDDVSSHYDLGISFKEMGLYDMAIEEFKKSMKDKNHEFKSLEMLGQCYLEQNLFDQAEGIFIKALSMKGKQPQDYLGIKYALALLYENKKMYDQSLKLYNEILTIKPDFKDVKEHIANINKSKQTPIKEQLSQPKDEFIDFSELLKDDDTTSSIQELQNELDNIEIDIDEDDDNSNKTKNITYM